MYIGGSRVNTNRIDRRQDLTTSPDLSRRCAVPARWKLPVDRSYLISGDKAFRCRSSSTTPTMGTPGFRTNSARCSEHELPEGECPSSVRHTAIAPVVARRAHRAGTGLSAGSPPVLSARSARRHPVSCSQDVDVLADAVGSRRRFHFGGDPASGAAGAAGAAGGGSMLAEPPWASVVGALGAGGGVTSTLVAGVSTAGFSTVGSAGVATRAVVSAFARCRVRAALG